MPTRLVVGMYTHLFSAKRGCSAMSISPAIVRDRDDLRYAVHRLRHASTPLRTRRRRPTRSVMSMVPTPLGQARTPRSTGVTGLWSRLTPGCGAARRFRSRTDRPRVPDCHTARPWGRAARRRACRAPRDTDTSSEVCPCARVTSIAARPASTSAVATSARRHHRVGFMKSLYRLGRGGGGAHGVN